MTLSKPRFDMRISLGHIVSAAVAIGAAAIAFGILQANVADNTRRITGLEASAVRQVTDFTRELERTEARLTTQWEGVRADIGAVRGEIAELRSVLLRAPFPFSQGGVNP